MQHSYTGCFKKYPPKTFRNIFTSVKSFCVKFCIFGGNSYISTYFYHYDELYFATYSGQPTIKYTVKYTKNETQMYTREIYLNISSNGVNFSTSTHRFHPVKF